MVRFAGIIDSARGTWGVRFPDIVGCVGAGATRDDAIADATAALHDVLNYRTANGYPLPKASNQAKVLASGELVKGEEVVIVPHL